MGRKALIVALLLIVGGALAVLWLRRAPRDFANFPPTARGPWVAFGDSLTSGEGAAPGNDYPARLAERLGLKITNLGKPGDTTADGLQRLDDVTRLNPRVVLLCLGGNDGLQTLPHGQTFGNLAAIVERLHAEGAFVVLIGVRSASLRDQFASDFKRLARERRVLLVPDIFKGVLGHPSLMADYIHPNDAGYEVIAARLEKELRTVLPALQ